MENKRRKIHEQLEVVQTGFANGVAEGFPLNSDQKQEMIDSATEAYGQFLDALKCDWRNDPNSMETPRRVAKAYVNDLWAGMMVLLLKEIFHLLLCVHTTTKQLEV